MVYFLALLLLIWSMVYTAMRFMKYYRICREYKERTTATVTSVQNHVPQNKREAKGKLMLDVVMEYTIDGKKGSSEITVPAALSDQYQPSAELPIRYMVSGNGAVHIASDNATVNKVLYGHAAAFVVEFAAFIVIWVMML